MWVLNEINHKEKHPFSLFISPHDTEVVRHFTNIRLDFDFKKSLSTV